jgi:hypothetical protein
MNGKGVWTLVAPNRWERKWLLNPRREGKRDTLFAGRAPHFDEITGNHLLHKGDAAAAPAAMDAVVFGREPIFVVFEHAASLAESGPPSEICGGRLTPEMVLVRNCRENFR